MGFPATRNLSVATFLLLFLPPGCSCGKGVPSNALRRFSILHGFQRVSASLKFLEAVLETEAIECRLCASASARFPNQACDWATYQGVIGVGCRFAQRALTTMSWVEFD